MFFGCFHICRVLLSWTELLTVFPPWWGSPGQVWTQQSKSLEQPYEHTETTWRRWTWCASRLELSSCDSLTSNDSLHHHHACFGEPKSEYFLYCVKATLLHSIIDCLLKQTANRSITLQHLNAFSHVDAEKATCWGLQRVSGWGNKEDSGDSECGEPDCWWSECFTNCCWDFHSITAICLQWMVPER